MADDWGDAITGTSYQGRGSAAPKTSNDSGWGVEPDENKFNGSSRGGRGGGRGGGASRGGGGGGDWNCEGCQVNNFASRSSCFKCSVPKPDGAGGGGDSNRGGYGGGSSRGGEWACGSCSVNNFSNRTSCFKCNEAKPEGAGGGDSSGGARQPRATDWECGSCQANNFGNRSSCFKCSEPKPEGAGGGDSNRPSGGEWICEGCQEKNFSRRTECYKCSEPKPAGANGDKFTDDKPKEFYIPPEASTDEKEIFGSGIATGINFSKYDSIPVKVSGENAPPAIANFESSGLRPFLLDNVRKSGYTVPTPIQKHSIPIVLAKRDLMACAQTGSGKTAAFLLPIIHTILDTNLDLSIGKPHVVIISPTRELAIQIHTESCKFSNGSFIKNVLIYGGTASRHQGDNVSKGCHILVATPGRLMDFVDKGFVSFEDIRYVVLDEADRMLDMGFMPSVEKLMKHPTMAPDDKRQTLMFSATFPEDIQVCAGNFLKNYVFLTVGIIGGACADVEQTFEKVDKFGKRKKLMEILDASNPKGTMVFVETKRNADFLASILSETSHPTTSIHGDRMQREREEALRDFKNGKMAVLIATSVAARGLDIKNVAHVINYDMPKTVDEYVHRIGRTGRVGNRGKATSFYDEEQDNAISGDLLKILTQAGQPIPDFLANSGGGSYSQKSFGGQDVRNTNASGPAAQEEDEDW